MKHTLNLCLFLCLVVSLWYGPKTFLLCKDALLLWFETLVPSLFISMVIIRMLYKRNAFQCISSLWMKNVFHMDRDAIPIVICTMLLGFPAGASFVDQLCAQHILDKEGGHRLVLSCCYATAGFVIMTCGTVLFHSLTIGCLLFIAQLMAGLTIFYCHRHTWISVYKNTEIKSQPFMRELAQAITESGLSLYMIGGYLMLFMTLTALLFSFLPTSISMPLRIVAEFSSGTSLIQTLPFSTFSLAILTCMLLGFGGFCVHMQIYSMCEHISISYWRFFLIRIIQAVLSGCIFIILFLLFQTFTL